MQKLNFPNYTFLLKNTENNTLIFDIIRKRFVVCTPEEWVREHTVQFLRLEKNYYPSLLDVEKLILVRGIQERYDIVGYKPDGNIAIDVECKAPQVPITQENFDQIARYNYTLRAEHLMVTISLYHY